MKQTKKSVPVKGTQKKGRTISVGVSPLIVAVAGVFLAGSAFAFAAGGIGGNGSLLAAVISAFSHKSTITITQASGSPSGTILTNKAALLATYNVSVQNENWWSTIWNITVSIPVTGSSASTLDLRNLQATYQYCIPKGVTYGYDWQNAVKYGSCGSAALQTGTVTRDAASNTYTVTFHSSLPVFPQQSSGVLSIYGTPVYTTATPTTPDASLRTNILSTSARGSQCRTITYGLMKNGKLVNYGYTKCDPTDASIVYGTRTGNSIKVAHLYGYQTPPTSYPSVSVSDVTAGTGTAVSSGDTANIRYKATYKDGTLFADTTKDNHDFTLTLGVPSAAPAIQGLGKGLAGMKVGGERKITVVLDSSGKNTSTLVFDTWLKSATHPATGAALTVTNPTVSTMISTSTPTASYANYTYTFTVTAGNNDVYIGKALTRIAATAAPTLAGGGINWATTTTSTTGAAKYSTGIVSTAQSNTGDTSTAYKISAGYSRTFTVSIMMLPTLNGYTGIVLKGINYSLSSTLGSLYYTDLSGLKSTDLYLKVK